MKNILKKITIVLSMTLLLTTVNCFAYTEESSITNETFSEKSIVISILDCDRKTLFKLAKEIREQFKQESVLVYDASNKQFYFVDAK